MSKKNRERRAGETGGAGSNDGGGSPAINWLPIVLAVAALGLGFVAWTDGKRVKDDTSKRLSDMDARLSQIQTQITNAIKSRPAQQQGPDPNKVYPIKLDGAPAEGNPSAPIVIAEFSDYQ